MGSPTFKNVKKAVKEVVAPRRRCEIRAFEVLYPEVPQDMDMDKMFMLLRKKKYGVLKGFGMLHTENGKTHWHVGLILRQDKIKTLYWKDLKAYFTIEGIAPPEEHGPLTNPAKGKGAFDKKLQQYFDYCIDEEKHPGQQMSIPYLHKWKPQSASEKLGADDYIVTKIRDGLTVDGLEEIIDDPVTSLVVYKKALKNFDIYQKMIMRHTAIRDRKAQALLYLEEAKTYRPFQKGLTTELDNQDDRHIHNHHDKGNTGKNYWLDRENAREDTIVMQTSETKRIAAIWNEKKHKRIIIDVPKHKAKYLNTTAMEALKNGTIFSSLCLPVPRMKKSIGWKPSIVILTNEQIDPGNWTGDRATYSTTNDEFAYVCHD